MGRLELQHDVGERQGVAERRSGLPLVGEDDDARVVVAELELLLGEDHPVGDAAAELRPLERPPVREHGARQRDGNGGAGGEVPRAADDLTRLALPHVHRAQLEPVGVGVLARLEHPADAVEAEVAVGVGDAARLDRPYLGAREQQPLRELRRRHVDVDVVAQPGERDSQNCLSTRRSFSQNMRMSGMPRRCAAMRSSPKPQAKPLHSSGS